MKSYLYVLNWCLALLVGGLGWWLFPHMGGWPFILGLFLGGMLTAGIVSWEYHKDPSPDKDWRWRKSYFQKNYLAEIIIYTGFLTLTVVFATWIWRGFFHFLSGMFSVFLLNALIECVWAKLHRYGK